MNSHFDCKTIREEFLDLTLPGRELSAAGQAHVRQCAACAAELAALRQSWSAMDAWQAPLSMRVHRVLSGLNLSATLSLPPS